MSEQITSTQRAVLGNEMASEFRRLDKSLTDFYSSEERAIWWHSCHPIVDAVPITLLGWGEYEKLDALVESLHGR